MAQTPELTDSQVVMQKMYEVREKADKLAGLSTVKLAILQRQEEPALKGEARCKVPSSMAPLFGEMMTLLEGMEHDIEKAVFNIDAVQV